MTDFNLQVGENGLAFNPFDLIVKGLEKEIADERLAYVNSGYDHRLDVGDLERELELNVEYQRVFDNGIKIQQRLDQQKAERYQVALKADVLGLWYISNGINNIIVNRYWITEGRGAYKWNDDEYRQEAKWAFDEVLILIKSIQHPAQQRFMALDFPTVVQGNKDGLVDIDDEWYKWKEVCQGRHIMTSFQWLIEAQQRLTTRLERERIAKYLFDRYGNIGVSASRTALYSIAKDLSLDLTLRWEDS